LICILKDWLKLDARAKKHSANDTHKLLLGVEGVTELMNRKSKCHRNVKHVGVAARFNGP